MQFAAKFVSLFCATNIYSAYMRSLKDCCIPLICVLGISQQSKKRSKRKYFVYTEQIHSCMLLSKDFFFHLFSHTILNPFFQHFLFLCNNIRIFISQRYLNKQQQSRLEKVTRLGKSYLFDLIKWCLSSNHWSIIQYRIHSYNKLMKPIYFTKIIKVIKIIKVKSIHSIKVQLKYCLFPIFHKHMQLFFVVFFSNLFFRHLLAEIQ